MPPTYPSLPVLLDAIRNTLLLASQAAPVLQHDAVASHIRIRSHTPEQFEAFRQFTKDAGAFYIRHAVEHNGKEVIFARLTGNVFTFNGHLQQPIHWLEFTAPREDHENGPDAVVFKVAGQAKAEESKIMLSPCFYVRYQGKSAEDITNR